MSLNALLSFALAIVLMFCGASPVLAQASTSADQIINTSFNQMPPFENDGHITNLGGDLPNELGYNPARDWLAGQLPSEVVEVGDIDTGLGASLLTIQQISELTGLNIEELSIENLEFLRGVSLNEFLKDVPFLGDWQAADIPELAELTEFGSIFSGEGTLNEVVESLPDIGELGVLDVFGELPISAIPNLDVAQLADFAGIGDQVIANVPGLGDIPLGSFPIPASLPSINAFPIQDIAFGPTEYSGETPTPQPVSGGTNGGKTWEPLACSGGCPHIELSDNGWEGANWMTKAHRVKDGYGVLGSLFDEAGAYRLPFGPSFALQVTNTDEKTGKAEWGIAFRACSNGLVDLGCTAYFLEVPLGIETKDGDNILTGVRDGLGGATVPMEAPPGWEALRPDLPPELAGVISANTPRISRGGRSLCGDGPGGVKFEALGEAYHQIESRGSGDYGAVGIWVDLSYSETGKALGRYQYMSYRRDVTNAIVGTPEGAELLRKARNNEPISEEEVLSAFPPELQDSLFIADQTYMIELAEARGYSGDRLLEVLAQMHFRGPGVLNSRSLDSQSVSDALGTSLHEYGQRFRNYYREAESQLAEGDEESRCGKPSGSFINPLENGSTTFTRYFSKGGIPDPVTGGVSRHDGDDIAAPVGAAIVASDGGTVSTGYQFDTSTGKGYGNFVVIDHGGGLETLYAHASTVLAKDGGQVSQGDSIAEVGMTGGTTGPHLHFEVIVNKSPEAPGDYVDYSKTVRDIER